jgi:D-lactate dehydrogenase (cytochrome)
LFGAIAAEEGGGPFVKATREEDRNKLWQARHDAFWAVQALMPGKASLATDVCVPISRLADCVAETQADLAQAGLFGPIVGHVGDGNFHVVLFCDRDDAAEVAMVEGFLDRLVVRAIAMGGTSTGEHGIGRGKMKFLEREHGAAVGVMRAIKRALDPDNIMNPGKIVAT